MEAGQGEPKIMDAVPASHIAHGDLATLAKRCLVRAGASEANAGIVAHFLVKADLDGIGSHGVARIPTYVAHLRHGRVDGQAAPVLTRPSPGVVQVDARHGFAAPALWEALGQLPGAARATGIGLAAIGRAHLSGVLGHQAERLGVAGFAALLFANAPAAIAAPGGRTPRFGTNPIAFALPRPDGVPLVIDLSMGVVTRGSLMLAASRGEALPPGIAFDEEGQPTTDPAAALKGTIGAIGGAKGAVLSMAIDLMTATLTRSHFSSESRGGFELGAGPPYANGVVALAIDPGAAGAADMAARVEALCDLVAAEEGVRLPNQRRLLSRRRLGVEGIVLRPALLAQLRDLAGDG